jgi:hypothetical protein
VPHRVRLALVSFAAVVAVVAVPSGQATLKSQLVGHWRLVGTEQLVDGQPVGASGAAGSPADVGMISYTADGHMQAQLTRSQRPRVRAADAAPEQRRELARYTAYFGTFTVDEATRTVTHHRDGTFGPGARDFVRTAELTGTRLVLTTPPTVVDGKRRNARIIWERLPAAPVAASFDAASRTIVAGTWELVEHKTTLANGDIRRAFGESPKGLFFFHPDGHTSVQIVNPERPATPLDRASDDDLVALARTYLAYFGSFDVDPATKRIVVHTIADLNAVNSGADQTRFYTMDGNLMYLQAGTGQQMSRITWRRVR